MRVKAPAERNFRRARAKPSRRKRLRPRVSLAFVRRVLSVVLLVFGVYQTVAFAFTTPLLRVNRIAVRGNVRLSNGEVQALLEDLRGTSILQIDLALVRQRLVESPWVAEVALRRVLPATIEVFISERRPIGLCRLGQKLYLVDETGVVIDEFGPQYAEFDLPIVDGLVGAPPPRGAPPAEIDPRRAELASRVIAALGRSQEIGARLSQVDVTDPHDAVVLLDGDTALLHLGNDKFLERVQSYLELSSTLRERVAEIDYVDLRFDERVYVRPTGTQRRTGAAPRAAAPVSRQF
jgi:cell division protein FtsQ